MAIDYNPRIVTDGLVLLLDAGNIKSYSGLENILRYSEELDNSLWANVSFGTVATVDSDVIASPNGSITADKINFAPDGSGQSRRTQAFSNLSGTYTVSAYVKKGDQSSVSLYVTTDTSPFPRVQYNFDTDTVSGTGAARTLLSDGWVRISSTATLGSLPARVGFISGNTGYTYAWGLQLEKRSTLNDYYPTTTTRKYAETTWYDRSDKGNDGTLISGPTFDSDNGRSIVFDGTDDYVNCGASSDYVFGTGDFTVECWVWRDGSQADNASFAITHNGAFGGSDNTTWQFGLGNSTNGEQNKLVFYIGASSNFKIADSATFPNQTWTHVAVTRSGTTVTLYKNASSVGSGTSSQNLSDDDLDIGVNRNGESYWKGRISNAKLYNKALSASEVEQNFNALRRRFGI